MPDVTDFHTHNPYAAPGTAIINVPREALLHPETFCPAEGGLYSAGIHPWWTVEADDVVLMLKNLPLLLSRPEVVAVGECGFDALRGASLEEQERVFKAQVAMAEQRQLPVTLHVVRAYDRLLRMVKQLRPTTQWTVHGFRGKPQLARQLLSVGVDLSFGKRYNAESYALCPPHRRHRETDDDYLK